MVLTADAALLSVGSFLLHGISMRMNDAAGIGIGVAIGVAIGLASGNITMGIGIGIALAIAMGLALRASGNRK
jgi:uncharacterized protein (DUF2062 family)